METWQFLCALGFILCIAEIFIPSFVLLPIGVGMLITSVISIWVPGAPEILIIAAVVTSVVLILSRVLFLKFLSHHNAETKTVVNRCIGQKVLIVSRVDATTPGLVRFQEEEWRALASRSEDVFQENEHGFVVAINGNKLMLQKHLDEKL